jgi:endonuclease YncB( thermonuclease family)
MKLRMSNNYATAHFVGLVLFLSWMYTPTFFLSSANAFADFSGKVVSIIDGDTVEVLHEQKPERIRLNGIDCPEKGQAYGKKAKQAVANLVFGKEVTLQTYGLDKYGRTIADVLLPNGRNVNHQLVKDGWCWWYRKYAPGDFLLEKFEKDARDSKKGLWIDSAPVPPWVYRKAKRGQPLDFSDMVPFDSNTGGNGLSRGPPSLGITDLNLAPSSSYPIIGNRKSHIYHRPDCPNYGQIAPRNRVPFNSAHEAEEAGYRVARNCP